MAALKRWFYRREAPRDSVTSLLPPPSSSKGKAPASSIASSDLTPITTTRSRVLDADVSGNAVFYDEVLHGKQIRLLRIEPGKHGSPLSCNLVPAQLVHGQFPDYTALSYCWGPDTQPFTSITLNNRAGFRLSRHLRDGLIRLRLDDKPMHVWVDAICINQLNTAERGHQVQRMRNIYSQAHFVVIWLGELSRSAGVPTCKCHVPLANEQPGQAVCAEPGLSSLEHGNVDQDIQDKLHSDERRSSQGDYLGHVFWKRLWVIQEFCSARWLPTVRVGPHTISWDFFSDLLWPKRKDHVFQRLRHSPRQSLFDLLLSTSSEFYCAEPRDRIYALLGLIDDDEEAAPIEPDYDKPVVAVFEDAMLYMVRKQGSIDCLLDERTSRLFEHLEESDDRLPSWIPWFTAMRESHIVKTPDNYIAGYLKPDVSIVSNAALRILCSCQSDKALRMKALPFDNILHRVDTSKVSRFSAPLRRNILKQLNVDYSKPSKLGIDRAPNLGYLILEFLFAGTDISLVDTVKRAHQEMKPIAGLKWIPKHVYSEQLAKEFGFTYNDATHLDLTIAATFEDLLKKKLAAKDSERKIKTKFGIYIAPKQPQDRVFFSTKTGFSGIGPASLEPGDCVIVPFGSSRPLIVRGHGDHYVLVGDAVIPGIMSGQLMHLYERGLVKAGDFDLK